MDGSNTALQEPPNYNFEEISMLEISMEPRMDADLEASELREIEAMEARQLGVEAMGQVGVEAPGLESDEQFHGMMPVVPARVNEALDLTQSERREIFQESIFSFKNIFDYLLDEFAPKVFEKLDILLKMTRDNVINARNEAGIGPVVFCWACTIVTWVLLTLAFLIVISLTIIFSMLVLPISPFWALARRGFSRLLRGFEVVKQWIYSSG
jgi:hypothetical protein